MDHSAELNLKYLYSRCGMNLRVLGALLGVRGDTVYRWLRSYKEPCDATVRLLAVLDKIDEHAPLVLTVLIDEAQVRAVPYAPPEPRKRSHRKRRAYTEPAVVQLDPEKQRLYEMYIQSRST